MKTHRIIDVTGGDDIWTCMDPPSKVRRYRVGTFQDGVQVRGPQGTIADDHEIPDIRDAIRASAAMNDRDFDAYVPPDFREKDWHWKRT